jgi:CRISPR-associated protein Csx14
MSNILVATLGTSPGVITEAMDLLIEEGCQPDGVILLKTQNDRVKQSYDLLYEHIRSYYEMNWIRAVDIENYGDDIDTTEATKEFMLKACLILKNYKKKGIKCYVCIAGGRKTMSALLTQAVQFYGAERLFHIWAPKGIEDKGEIQKIRRPLDEEGIKNLHPNRNESIEEEDRPKIVNMPFLGIFPLLPKIIGALNGEASDSDIKIMLISSGLMDDRGKATDLGNHLKNMVESVERLPPPSEKKCVTKISAHNYKDKIEDMAKRLTKRFVFIEDIRSIEWGQGENKVTVVEPDKLNVMWTEGKRVRLGLQLTTTATTQGQLEAARKLVDEYLAKC